MAPLRILISGGGIAGNALAFWLSKIGHDVTVVERFSSLRDNGLQLDLRGHGIEVMKRMGLQEVFGAQVAPEKGMRLVDKRGRQRAFFPATTSRDGVQNFTTEFEIMRGDFCRILHDAAAERGAKFVFGTSIERMDDNGTSVEVRFANGKDDSFDLGELYPDSLHSIYFFSSSSSSLGLFLTPSAFFCLVSSKRFGIPRFLGKTRYANLGIFGSGRR